MKFLSRFLLLVSALFIAAFISVLLLKVERPAGAAPTDIQLSPVATLAYNSAAEKALQRFDALQRSKAYPSISASVFIGAKHVWSASKGYADLQSASPASIQSVYPIGSVSKPFTAALTMKLAEGGAVDLDAPIGMMADGLSDEYAALTLRQLLSHQAGVRHYKFAWKPPVFTENGLNHEYESIQDSLSIFIHDPLLFPPDEGFEYSTYGYTLASYVLEQATGKTFLKLLNDELAAPLSLTTLAADRQGEAMTERTSDYISALRRLAIFPSPQTNSSYKWAGGGLIATPEDLARFGAALLNNDYLSEASFLEMTTPRKTKDGNNNPQHYGLGWRSGTMTYPRESETATPIIHHGGTALGAECALLLAPELNISVAACGNAFTGGSGHVVQLAADIARDFTEADLSNFDSLINENLR